MQASKNRLKTLSDSVEYNMQYDQYVSTKVVDNIRLAIDFDRDDPHAYLFTSNDGSHKGRDLYLAACEMFGNWEVYNQFEVELPQWVKELDGKPYDFPECLMQ